ncbi:MAG: endolytic transglycosylase MltG [Candidatus Sumerlaeia bacterium]
MSESENVSPPKRRGILWRLFRLLIAAGGFLFLLMVLSVAGALVWFEWWAGQGRDGSPEMVEFEIERGDSFRRIARRLEQDGLVEPDWALVLLAYRLGVERQVQAGQYRFSGESPREILQALVRGQKGPSKRLTFPEGWTVGQMAQRLQEAGVIGDGGRFLALCGDRAFLESIDIPADSAEGFLFPDTYEFALPTDEAEAIKRLALRLEAVIDSLDILPGINSPHAHPLNFYDSITLASIIEREARGPDEMRKIASVFHNRLKRGMRLDSCATVRYALNQWTAPLRLSDLDVESPYNTYRRKGLPPGPICNPGHAAIDAAFRPEDTDFLYYVYKGQGRHAFSKSLSEHNRLKRQYKNAWKFSASRDGD